jgi:transcriptional regulator with XRE-family HTH domain
MAVDYVIIGQRLKNARKSADMTQQELAEKLNLSVAFISRVERGSSHINLRRLTEFCSALGISEGTVLNGVSNMDEHYLSSEFNDILEKCSPKKQKLIYKLSKIIAEEEE